RRHPVRRLWPWCEQGGSRQRADVTVGRELTPGPALLVDLVDRHTLAAQRFGDEWRVVRRLLPHRREADDHLLLRAFDELLGLDLAAQMCRREIGARRRDTGVEICHGHGPASRMIASENRLSVLGIMRAPSAPSKASRRRRGCRPQASRAPCARYLRRAPARSFYRSRASGSWIGGRSRNRWSRSVVPARCA